MSKQLDVKIFYSTKRTETLKEYFKDFPEMQYRNMLKHSSTRWLSLRPCLDRLINFYDPVSKYFIDCKEADKKGKAQNVRELLQDPSTKPVLMFLSSFLKSVDRYNLLFQVKYCSFFYWSRAMGGETEAHEPHAAQNDIQCGPNCQ